MIKTAEEQLALWVGGESVHMGAPDTGQCVPDFSCCLKGLPRTPLRVRLAFLRADNDGRLEMCGMFLQAAISLHERTRDKRVVVSTGRPPGRA